ncbi:MAG: viperin family antiviral radical SAM protein [Nonlabens sp.]
MKIVLPPTINYHLWKACNMRCKFCFATFQDVPKKLVPKGHLPKEESKKVIKLLAQQGIDKINFAGGEPLLCPWLGDLIIHAKELGIKTSIITNGSHLTKNWLEQYGKYLDLIGISMDSLHPETNVKSGRFAKGKGGYDYNTYLKLASLVKDAGIPLKINTVVSQYNLDEDMNLFISEVSPSRWKVFKVLPIGGQNEITDGWSITETEFNDWLYKHKEQKVLVPENNDAMTASYGMIDPAGRFYDNEDGIHNYSKPILEIGALEAFKMVAYDHNRFKDRGGIYELTATK